MNIAPSTTSAAPTANARQDASTTGHIVPDPGVGVDTPAANGTTPVSGFGSLLSRHLDDAAGSDPTATTSAVRSTTRMLLGDFDPKLQATADGADPTVADDRSAAPAGAAPVTDAASGAAAVVPADLFPTLAAATASAIKPGTAVQGAGDGTSRKGRVDDDATRDGDAGSDLAAQLALASQWARPADGAAQVASAPVGTAVSPTVVSGAAAAGPDTKALPGKDRVPSGKDDGVSSRGATLSTAAGPAGAAAAARDAAGPDARQPDDRAATAMPAVVAKDPDTKARGDTVAAALEAASAIGTVATPHADTIATGDLFAARLATHGATAGILTGTSVAATSASTASTAASSASAAFAFVQEPVGSGGWSHEVGQAALRMAANDLQSASIRLNPEHLGPLDVQVRVDDGVAHLTFTATHADTRQALEASRGTLDQMFSGQGLKMGDVSVGAGAGGGSNDAFATRGDPSADASRRDGGNRWSGDDAGADSDAPATTVTTRIARALGLVDTFA